jgi:hypothetical protein
MIINHLVDNIVCPHLGGPRYWALNRIAATPGSGEMPILKILESHSGFGPEDVEAMARAFERACKTLQPSSDQISLRELIAMKIVANARCGERDPDRLCQLAISEIQTGLSPSTC